MVIDNDSFNTEKIVTDFIKSGDTGVDFFVMDKMGRLLYKSNTCKRQIIELTSKELLLPESKLNFEVINMRKQTIVEESISSNSNYLSVKSPFLVNNVVKGVVVFSIDISKKEDTGTDNLGLSLSLTEEIVHEIHSPLVALSIFLESCKNFSEKEYDFLTKAVDSIRGISSRLLEEYEKKAKKKNDNFNVNSYVLVPIGLSDIAKTKKYQFSRRNVIFEFSNPSCENIVFIKGKHDDFNHVISSLIDCAMMKFNIDRGKVNLNFCEMEQKIEIYVEDNWSCIADNTIKQIINGKVGDIKDEYVNKMRKVRDIIMKMDGDMKIESRQDIGTKVSLIFTRVNPPKWFVKEVVIPKGALVIILDDDPYCYELLRTRLDDYSEFITVKYFEFAKEAIDFIIASSDKKNLFLMTDYYLKNQELNGIDVIEKCNLYTQAILVTNYSANNIREFPMMRCNVRVLSKSHIPYVSFKLKD